MNPTQSNPGQNNQSQINQSQKSGQNINKQNIKQPQRTAAGETSEPNVPLDPSGEDNPNVQDEVTGSDDDIDDDDVK